jgi:ABC-2 type transport system permease protein
MSAANRIGAVMVRHGYTILRKPTGFLSIAVWPVVDMLLYSSIAMYARGSGNTSASTRTAVAVVSGIIMWHLVYQSQLAVSTSFFEEIYTRQLPSLLATPLRPIEWVLGAALQGLVKVAIGVTAVATAAGVLYGFNITGTGLAIIPAMALLLLTGWSMALVVMGLVMFLGTGTETIAYGLLFIILPLSGAFYSVSVLPDAIQVVSAVLPTTYTFSAARAVTTGDTAPWDDIGVAAIGTTALIVAALGFATYSLRVFQRRGFISRYQ